MAGGEFAPVMERLENALALSGQPVKRGTMAHEHIMYMMLADTAAAARDLAAIDRYAPLLENLATRDNHLPYLAVAKRAIGTALRLRGSLSAADAMLSEAQEIFRNAGLAWQSGRTLAEIGVLRSDQGRSSEAEKFFEDALDEFERIGARPAFENARKQKDSVLG